MRFFVSAITSRTVGNILARYLSLNEQNESHGAQFSLNSYIFWPFLIFSLELRSKFSKMTEFSGQIIANKLTKIVKINKK